MNRPLLVALFGSMLGSGALAAPIPSVTLLPAGTSASPGATLGWGFTLAYPAPSNWVVLTGSSFIGSSIYGSYVDYLSTTNAPLYIAGGAPESTVVTQPWNGASSPRLGLGEFDVNSTALVGAVIGGNIVVHYSVFSQDPNDPNFNPDLSTVVADATVSDPVAFGVTPEPASIELFAVGLFFLALIYFRRRKLSPL